MKKHRKKADLFIHIILIFLLILLLYPLFMAFWSALKSRDMFFVSRWYPTMPFYLSNIVTAFSQVSRYMFNTVFVAVTATLGMIIISTLSAYTFARMEFPGKKLLFALIIGLMMIPGVLTLVPSYVLYKNIIGLDNYSILILPTIVGAPVFGTFLLRTFFEGVPESIFEAAKIDGSSEFKTYYKICMPLSVPIIITLAIMQINGIWNDYLWPMITIKNEKLYTISAGLLLNYVGAYSSNYPLIFAGYLVASIPLILVFVYANKYYIEGLTSSGMKL